MFKKFNLILLSLLLLVALVPFSSFATDDTGQITVSIVDENKDSFPGMWYIRQGGSKGAVLRNGTYGEKFNFGPGVYYLQVHPKNPDHPYYFLSSTNPQTLTSGGNINFQVQYFKTEADKLVAQATASQTGSGSSTTTTTTAKTATSVFPDLVVSSVTHSPSSPTTSDKVTFTAVVKNTGSSSAGSSMLSFQVEGITSSPKYYNVPGLNAGETYTVTQQISLDSTKMYTANFKADTYNDVKEANETNNATKDSVTVVSKSAKSSASASTTSGSSATYVYAPKFETPKTTTDSTASSTSTPTSSALAKVPQLAATGPATLALFALAPLLGGLAIRRRK